MVCYYPGHTNNCPGPITEEAATQSWYTRVQGRMVRKRWIFSAAIVHVISLLFCGTISKREALLLNLVPELQCPFIQLSLSASTASVTQSFVLLPNTKTAEDGDVRGRLLQMFDFGSPHSTR